MLLMASSSLTSVTSHSSVLLQRQLGGPLRSRVSKFNLQNDEFRIFRFELRDLFLTQFGKGEVFPIFEKVKQ